MQRRPTGCGCRISLTSPPGPVFANVAFAIDGYARRITRWRASRTAHAGFASWMINGLNRAEVTHRRRPWKSFEAVEFSTLEWIDWFDNRRLLASIGNFLPTEGEAAHYSALAQPSMAACLKPNGLRQTRGGSTPFGRNHLSRQSSCWSDSG
jgi:transposase InsO family protein